MKMKRLALAAALAMLAAGPAAVGAQAPPPPLPELTAAQSAQVQQEVSRYRADTEARVARGEITPDEAELLIAWREWQLAQQAAGLAPRAPQIVERTGVAPYYAPAPWYGYGPYWGPYYAPRPPVYWGLSFCAGRAWRSGWGSFCF
jgi:hypothetical protein